MSDINNFSSRKRAISDEEHLEHCAHKKIKLQQTNASGSTAIEDLLAMLFFVNGPKYFSVGAIKSLNMTNRRIGTISKRIAETQFNFRIELSSRVKFVYFRPTSVVVSYAYKVDKRSFDDIKELEVHTINYLEKAIEELLKDEAEIPQIPKSAIHLKILCSMGPHILTWDNGQKNYTTPLICKIYQLLEDHRCILVSQRLPEGIETLDMRHMEAKYNSTTKGAPGVSTFRDYPIERYPSTLTHLKLHENAKGPLNNLPPSLIHLELQSDNRIDNLPDNLLHLKTGHEFDDNVDNLPWLLDALEFGDSFNQPVNLLPMVIRVLTFGQQFNRSVDYLPGLLEVLQFGDHFNQPVNFLPRRLKHLKFGHCFNQSVDMLPPHLISLEFGREFNQQVNYLPSQLKSLKFGHGFNQSIDNLPLYLMSVVFVDEYGIPKHSMSVVPTAQGCNNNNV